MQIQGEGTWQVEEHTDAAQDLGVHIVRTHVLVEEGLLDLPTLDAYPVVAPPENLAEGAPGETISVADSGWRQIKVEEVGLERQRNYLDPVVAEVLGSRRGLVAVE